MDVYECIRTRRTIREFKPDPVPEAIVQKILQAGRWAPSSSNTQPWHFVVVRARETIAALGRIATQGPFIGQAPLAIAIVMAHAGRPQLDAGRALQQMSSWRGLRVWGPVSSVSERQSSKTPLRPC
jgi:nitroreductase